MKIRYQVTGVGGSGHMAFQSSVVFVSYLPLFPDMQLIFFRVVVGFQVVP